jgi:hypothetical protein
MSSERQRANVACSDTTGNSCDAKGFAIAKRVLEEFPELLAQLTYPEIAAKGQRLGIKLKYPAHEVSAEPDVVKWYGEVVTCGLFLIRLVKDNEDIGLSLFTLSQGAFHLGRFRHYDPTIKDENDWDEEFTLTDLIRLRDLLTAVVEWSLERARSRARDLRLPAADV